MSIEAKNDWARLAMTAAIVGYFGWALVAHWSNGIEETLKSAFMIAVGFWLGSSKGSAEKQRHIAEQATGKQDDPVHTKEETL